MSHKATVFSPAGTPLLDRTVGELVAERPGRSRVFQGFRIDFCCQGARTLREACELKGIASASVVEQLEAESAAPADEGNPASLPPADLADYINRRHHGYLKKELPRLFMMAQRVAQVHGSHNGSLIELFHVFSELDAELVSHLQKEEEILFPAISAMAAQPAEAVVLEGPIACMLDEHDHAGQALARLRELSNDFQPPAEACNTYRALFAGLRDLEEDLHKHIHLENSVLFPAARRMAAAGV